MSNRFRDTTKVNYVKPHSRAKSAMGGSVRAVRTAGETVQADETQAPTTSLIQTRKATAWTAKTATKGATVATRKARKLGKKGYRSATRRTGKTSRPAGAAGIAGGASTASRAGEAGQHVKKVVRPVGKAATAGVAAQDAVVGEVAGEGDLQEKVGGLARLTAQQTGKTTGKATVKVGKKAAKPVGRVAAQGARRVGHVAARVATQTVARAVAMVTVKLGTVGTAFALPIVVIAVIVLAILSFIPSWITNFFLDEEISPISFAMGDDYPWADKVRDGSGNATDVFNTPNPETNYYYGNCTDFVYWRVNRDMGGGPGNWVYSHDDLTPNGGDGRLWGKEGKLPGWETISSPDDAQPGDIISFESGVFGHNHPAGHVAYVASVTDGEITTENYGAAQYYVEKIPEQTAKDYMASNDIVIKRNPALQDRADAILTGEVDDSVAPSGDANQAVAAAKGMLGLPYGRGQGNGSVDCCWLVYNAYKNGRGITLPMSSPGNPASMAKCEYAMYEVGMSSAGTYVSATTDNLKSGDILFFQSTSVSALYDNITHVGIYVGNGQMIDSIPGGGVGIRPLSFYRNSDIILPQAVRLAA